jgi:3'(2'), 5'-bisphosphate nucleotidase
VSKSLLRFCACAKTSLRIPTKYSGGKEYQEKIWDHASGALLIAESGGICTDMFGQPLDFSVGRTLKNNEGIVAAGKEIHGKAVEAVKKAIEAAKEA